MASNRSSDGENPVRFYRVPAEVIKAWDRGEYFTGGVPSLAYQYLGTALRLRGLYTYRRDDDINGDDFKGVAKIELVGRELVMEGIRLWADKQKPNIRFWKTEFSHFLSDDKIIWTYRIFECDSDQQFYKHIPGVNLSSLKNDDEKSNFGFSQANWEKLLQFLLSDKFAKELSIAEEKCKKKSQPKMSKVTTVMLHFKIPDVQNHPDAPITALYRQLRSGEHHDISGGSRFDRIQTGP